MTGEDNRIALSGWGRMTGMHCHGKVTGVHCKDGERTKGCTVRTGQDDRDALSGWERMIGLHHHNWRG